MFLMLQGIVLVSGEQVVLAEPLESRVHVFGVSQQDADGNGVPERTVIDCSIASPQDRVTVVDGAQNMLLSDRWDEATDFIDDTWIFDIGGRGVEGEATFIIDFQLQGGDTVAQIFDQIPGGGPVRYEIEGSQVRVSAPQTPSLVIRAEGQWMLPGDIPNYNLTWQVNGPKADLALAERFPNLFRLEGEAEREGRLRDANRDGVPEYIWSTLVAPIPASEGISRTGIQVNSGLQRPSSPASFVFWPMLDASDRGSQQNYFDTAPTMKVDWGTGSIGAPGFSGYPTEHGYHVNSLSSLSREGVNALNFENPMAYYDLAGDQDGRPELFIRMAYTEAGYPYFVNNRANEFPIEMIQYSWNQTNAPALTWDYKVDLAGRNSINATVSLDDVVLEQVPHEQLPGWVAANGWEFGTFVAVERGDYVSSEGIYEWSTLEGVVIDMPGQEIVPNSEWTQRTYLAGIESQPPDALYQQIRPGLRGEYVPLVERPELYVSPIDRRLHMVGAIHGVYNIDDRRYVRYLNLDGDDYFDVWQLYENQELVGQLMQVDGGVLYGDGETITLLKTPLPRDSFRGAPPADQASWLSLNAVLGANEPEFAADDLRAMTDQFSGERSTISGAVMRDFRMTEEGYQFVLELHEGYDLSTFPLEESLTPGTYIVTYMTETKSFEATPWEPADPAITAIRTSGSIRSLSSLDLLVDIENRGVDGFSSDPLCRILKGSIDGCPRLRVIATRSGDGQEFIIADETIDLDGGATDTRVVTWTPTRAGTWTLVAWLYLPDGTVARQMQEIVVDSPSSPTWEDVITAGWPSTWPTAYIVTLIGLVGCAAGSGLILLRRFR